MSTSRILQGHTLAERYTLEALIGEGGMGAVFRARDLRLDREVAVKVFHLPHGVPQEKRARLRERFRQEARAVARLPYDPHLVTVHDYGTDAALDLDFIVMELLRGEDLAQRLARGAALSAAEALEVLRQAARGLAVGHRAGLVHRDVKPANLFLAADSETGGTRVRVLDFGIARRYADEGEEETSITRTGEWMGSWRYAAPEHLSGERRLTPAADVFSLGVVAYELLAGRHPYTREDQLRREIGAAVPVPSLRARAPDVPEEVEALVLRAMAERSEDRYPDATAFGRAVLAAEAALATGAHAPRLPPRDSDADAAVVAMNGGGTLLALAPAPQLPARRRAFPSLPTVPGLARLRPGLRRVAGVAALVGVAAAGAVAGVSARGDAAAEAAAPAPRFTAREANEAGLGLFRAGDYEGALARFREAERLSPGHPEYMNNAAYALVRAGRTEDAVGALEAVVAAHPRRQEAHWNLAEARLVAGDTAGAIADLETLLSLEPAARRRAAAESLLERLRRAWLRGATPAPRWDDLDPGVYDRPARVPAYEPPPTRDDAGWDAPYQVDAADTVVLPQYPPRPGYGDTIRLAPRR